MSDVEDVVDEIVDELNPEHIEDEATRLNLTVDDLMQRVVNELKTRLS